MSLDTSCFVTSLSTEETVWSYLEFQMITSDNREVIQCQSKKNFSKDENVSKEATVIFY